MKKYALFAVLLVILAAGCKKDKPGGGQGNTAINYTPNLITLAYQPGIPIDLLTYHIYDLDHDNNKDKKFFRIKFITNDSAIILQEPKSIDSLAPGWPADVKNVRWGSGAEYILNDQFFIRGGNSFSKITYNQTAPQHAWLSQWKTTVGVGAGLPNAEVLFSPSDFRLFYFSSRYMSYYTGTAPNPYSLADIGSLSGLGNPFNIYNYTDVTNLIFIKSASNTRLYFFDYKNWRYWAVGWEFVAAFSDYAWVAGPVKNLNSLVKWPVGWGKK
jgi:hypothetical protein